MNKKTSQFICIVIIGLTMCVAFSAYAGKWRDDFEDNNILEWEIFNLVRQVEKWWINDGNAVGEIFEPGFMSLWLTGELDWRFYRVSCRAMLEHERNDPPYIGITLHDREFEESRYLFTIDYVVGSATIVKGIQGGGFVRSPFIAEKDVWYDMSATVYEDGTLEFKIDDFVLTANDPDPLKGGKAGLVVGDARARFDDVEISGTNIPNGGPGKPRDVAPQAKLATTWGELKRK